MTSLWLRLTRVLPLRRESKLTRALQDTLGGDAKTMLIVCCAQVSV